MTYCVGIKINQGIVGIADTRITSGTTTTMAKKLFTYEKDNNSLFIMTSGLRSIRDKAIIYFNDILEDDFDEFDKMYKVANSFSNVIKRVGQEDKESLHEANLNFNIHALVGGQMHADKEHKLFLLYPEGNWIEIGNATPFMIIGNSGFGKPVLNRSISVESDIKFALKTALLSFDSTRVSANDVGYPIDIFIYLKNSFHIIEERYNEQELKHFSEQWAAILTEGIHSIEEEWMNRILGRLP